MMPVDREELEVLAGEYVLGTLDAAEAAEVERALSSHAALRDAVDFWQDRLHPLSALAAPVAPNPATWDAIRARLKPIGGGVAAPPRLVASLALWRGLAAAAVLVAIALGAYILATPRAPNALAMALLRAPHENGASWVAVVNRGRLELRATAAPKLASDRAYELWAIAPGTAAPEPVGIVRANGTLSVPRAPRAVRNGATLAISIEPGGGSPTGKPTGPVVFTGSLESEL